MEDRGDFYEDKTESPRVVREILDRSKINPRRILSVVGAWWPMELQEMFPRAQVFSFDANYDQIEEMRQDIVDSTKNKPVLASVPGDRFEHLLGSQDFDLLFISNIPDYLEPDQAIYLAEEMDQCDIPAILFSSLGDRMTDSSKQQSAHALMDSLKEYGYEIKRYKDGSATHEIVSHTLAIRR
jgi:hypothetical protein